MFRKKLWEKRKEKQGYITRLSDDHYKSDFNNLVFDKKNSY